MAGGPYMKTVMYSVLFIAAFYLVGMACNILGLTDEQSGIPILIGVFVVLGIFIARGANKEK